MKVFLVLLLVAAAWAYPSFEDGSFISNPLPGEDIVYMHHDPEYYWRDYDGEVPADAFDASNRSEPLYVGQGYFKGVGMLPGSLHAGTSALVGTASGKNYKIFNNVRILCSKSFQNLRWIQINFAEVPCLEKIPGIRLVSGGDEGGVPLYIGRHRHEGVLAVGKFYTEAPYQALHLPNKNGGQTAYKNFEILVYV